MFVKTCPKCGGIVVKDDMYDTQHGGGVVVELYCGHCIKCGTDYQWESYYKWSIDTDLEEA